MVRQLSFATALLLVWPLSGPKYSGPQCLGPFCIDRNTSVRKLSQHLGPPPRRASRFDPYCYQSQDGRTWLYLQTEDSEPDWAVEAFLSDFSNCEHMPKRVTADNLRSWKTRQGIGLGSLESDVAKAYGKPTDQGRIDPTAPHALTTLIKGYRAGDKIPPLGDKVMSYRGDLSSDLSAADFGICGGKVCWIWLSCSE